MMRVVKEMTRVEVNGAKGDMNHHQTMTLVAENMREREEGIVIQA